MKRNKLIAMLLSLILLLSFPVGAESAPEESAAAETSADDIGQQTGRNNTGPVLLLFVVVGAMIISAFVYRVRDNAKYL